MPTKAERSTAKNRYYSGRKAVGCRSRRGEYNPNAISSYLRNEISMNPYERKNSLLPCGYTIAESWAALRKSWLGFNIAHSTGNYVGMSKYASVIRKLQREMGIQVTKFDPEILDEEDLAEDVSNERSTNKLRKDLPTLERSTDYEAIVGDALMEINRKGEVFDGPREEIFAISPVDPGLFNEQDQHEDGSNDNNVESEPICLIDPVDPGLFNEQDQHEDGSNDNNVESEPICLVDNAYHGRSGKKSTSVRLEEKE